MSRFVLAAILALTWSAVTWAQEADPSNHYILSCDSSCSVAATDVAIGTPTGMTVDAAGNVYFTSQHVVFRLDRAGRLYRVAGNGQPGYSGDGGFAISARLDMPEQYVVDEEEGFATYITAARIAIDVTGNLFVMDFGNGHIRVVLTGGMIATLADAEGRPLDVIGAQGLATSPDGSLYFGTGGVGGGIMRLDASGALFMFAPDDCSVAEPNPCGPGQMAVDGNGELVFPDLYCRVLRWSPVTGGSIIAGEIPSQHWVRCGRSENGHPARGSALGWVPYAAAVDASNRVYVADTSNHCVRRIDENGIIDTVAGTCGAGGEPQGDGDRARSATLNKPTAIGLDRDGNLYIADTGNRRIRRVGTNGIITTVAGNGQRLP